DDVTYEELRGAPHYLEGHRPPAMALVAALAAPVGGVGPAVACVVLLALPAAALLLRSLPDPGPPLSPPRRARPALRPT
ncbi:MAG TPA: hypothetical protein VHQ66_09455, partial [Myxococcota bacterium]|nr:hypothetical protein [Myxococcota bacterium]